ncbi:hypothetical protein B7435_23650 [Mycolicibacterium peregrinum]|nr:hypothetical protein [Mycobacteriaceae bacterium Msp059]OWL98893.1 hypothetical protein B7435_23650 [Mycolicibacterium peregrinum]
MTQPWKRYVRKTTDQPFTLVGGRKPNPATATGRAALDIERALSDGLWADRQHLSHQIAARNHLRPKNVTNLFQQLNQRGLIETADSEALRGTHGNTQPR